MACLRLTLLDPRQGREAEALRLIEELDEDLAASQGLILSCVTRCRSGKLGRMSLWRTRQDADREATREHVLSLRSRLRVISNETREILMQVESGHVPRELTALLAGSLDVEDVSDRLVVLG